MKNKIYILVLVFQLFWLSSAGAAVVLEENFNGAFPPSGWSRVIYEGSCSWESTDTTGTANLTGGTGDAAIADSNWCGFEMMDVELRTPSFSLAGITNAELSFQTDFYIYSEAYAYVRYQYGCGGELVSFAMVVR